MNLHAVSIPLALLLVAAPDCNPEPIDADGDGFPADVDCDDADASINPGAMEICDGVDNDCDGVADEGTCAGTVTYTFRDSLVEIYGEDNGRVEGTYANDEGADDFEVFEAAIRGSLEYVSSNAEQYSYVEEREIYAFGDARSSGQDDYGYGVAYAYGNSDFYVGFTLDAPAYVTLEAVVENSTWDGGSSYTAVELLLGRTRIFSMYDPGAQAARMLLEAGSYQLHAIADTQVSMSGGGDAYPSAQGYYQVSFIFD